MQCAPRASSGRDHLGLCAPAADHETIAWSSLYVLLIAAAADGQRSPWARVLPFCCTRPLPLVGVSIVMERGCQQKGSLARGGAVPAPLDSRRRTRIAARTVGGGVAGGAPAKRSRWYAAMLVRATQSANGQLAGARFPPGPPPPPSPWRRRSLRRLRRPASSLATVACTGCGSWTVAIGETVISLTPPFYPY